MRFSFSVGVRIANAAACKPEGREGSEMRAAARNARIGGLRQARLPDQMLASGCSHAIACVTLHWRATAAAMQPPTGRGAMQPAASGA